MDVDVWQIVRRRLIDPLRALSFPGVVSLIAVYLYTFIHLGRPTLSVEIHAMSIPATHSSRQHHLIETPTYPNRRRAVKRETWDYLGKVS